MHSLSPKSQTKTTKGEDNTMEYLATFLLLFGLYQALSALFDIILKNF